MLTQCNAQEQSALPSAETLSAAPEVELQLLHGCVPSDATPDDDADHRRSTATEASARLEAWHGGGAWRQLCAQPWVRVLRLIATPAASVWAIYFVTLFIFPGFLSEDLASSALGSWFPVLLFLVYNASDWASRFVQAPHAWLLPLCAAR